MKVVGTGATPTAYTNPVQGDVYIVTSGEDSGKEYVYTGSDWEEFGINEVNLAEYAKTEDLGALATKDNVSVPADTFLTALNSSTSTETFNVLQSQASNISNWSGGSVSYSTPTFAVANGILSLTASTNDVAYTAPSFTNTPVQPTTITITHNVYNATKNSAMTLS